MQSHIVFDTTCYELERMQSIRHDPSRNRRCFAFVALFAICGTIHNWPFVTTRSALSMRSDWEVTGR